MKRKDYLDKLRKEWAGDKNPAKTPEARKKISNSRKGVNNRPGWKQPEEVKRKISESHKGLKPTEESRLKMSNALRGKLGSLARNWRGGITPLVRLVRECSRYRVWRSDAFTRDDYVCQICFKRGGIVNADHIKPFSLIMAENKITTYQQALDCEELWNLNNGRTLCRECHLKTETYGRSKRK